MDNQQQSEAGLSAAECAQRIGLSVRALRHYERHGLVTPRRTDKQWRLYGPEDITRLNEVLALKGLGPQSVEHRGPVAWAHNGPGQNAHPAGRRVARSARTG